jgi:YD repeat-containing protein
MAAHAVRFFDISNRCAPGGPSSRTAFAGRRVSRTDADGRVTKYQYDALNRQVEEDWLDGGTPFKLSSGVVARGLVGL